MKQTLTYLFLITVGCLLSQTTFTIAYNQHPVNNYKYSFDESFRVFEYNKSLFLIGTFEENTENSGVASDGIPDTTHAMLMKVDLSGNKIFTNFYTANSCSNNLPFFKVKNNILIATGLIQSPNNFCGAFNPSNPPPNIDPILKRRIFVAVTNLDSGSKTERIYRTGEDSWPFGIQETNDGNFFIANIITKDRVVCLLKIKPEGDSIVNKVLFDSIPFDYEPILFDKTATGYSILFYSSAGSFIHVEKLDNSGNVTAQINKSIKTHNINTTSDGGYIILERIGIKTKLTKVDSNFGTEWEKTYDVYANNFVQQTRDNNYLIGNKDITKVNKDSVIWTRRFFGNDNINPWYFFHNSTETSDGGLAMVGFYDANSLLVKTDCMGSLIWDSGSCKPLEVPTYKTFESSIFPNPFKDSVTFRLSDTSDSTVKIRIANLLGQMIYDGVSTSNVFTLNTTTFPCGVYVCYIWVNDKHYKAVKLVKPNLD